VNSASHSTVMNPKLKCDESQPGMHVLSTRGRRAASLQHPSWADAAVGWQPFPWRRLSGAGNTTGPVSAARQSPTSDSDTSGAFLNWNSYPHLTCPHSRRGFPAKAVPPPRKRRLSLQQRRALQFLVSNPFGATAALMLSQGVPRRTLASLVRAGLVTARHQSVEAGGAMVEVVRFLMTDTGRRAIGE
jgi:hypothetical protein